MERRVEEATIEFVKDYIVKRVIGVLNQEKTAKGDKPMKSPESVIDVYEEMMLGEENTVVDAGDDVWEENIKIYSSTDYDKFSLIRSNRPVDYDRVNRMVKAINEGHSYFGYYPALVNTDFEIVDGQHRHAAARLTQTRFHYILTHGFQMEDAARAVSNTKGWKMSDWLHHYSELGFPEYEAIHNFWNEFSWLPISKVIELCSTRKYTAAIFNGGHYQANSLDHARRVVTILSYFKNYAPDYWRTSPFIQTMSSISANPLYMHKRMQEKMRTQSSRLRRCATVEHYLELLSEIYNYRMPPENKVFLDEAYRRKRTQVREDAADNPA